MYYMGSFSQGQSYLHALEQYPSKSAHQKLLKTQKRETAELREMLDRVAVRKGAAFFKKRPLLGNSCQLPWVFRIGIGDWTWQLTMFFFLVDDQL